MLPLTTVANQPLYPNLFRRHLRSIPTERLKKLIAEEKKKLGQSIAPGRDDSSTWWITRPREPSKKVVAMRPVKPLPKLRISMVREGCRNRPFFTIQVKSSQAHSKDQGVEQVGCWDPFPNHEHGEQLVGLNVERILHWLAQGAEPTDRVAELLGLAGILPLHPHSRLVALRTRLAVADFKRRVAQEAPAPSQGAAAVAEEAGLTPPEQREDFVWRRKGSTQHWWRHGLI